MSFFSAITNALKLVPGVTAAIEAVANAMRKPKAPEQPVPFGRKHAWGYGLDPVLCAYCHTPLRATNKDSLCLGPKAVR